MRSRQVVVVAAVFAALLVGAWLAARPTTEDAKPVAPKPDVRRTTPPAARASPPVAAPAPPPPAVERPPQPAAPPSSATDEIVGVVEDARGRPVAGATVVALRPRPATLPIDLVSPIRDLGAERPSAATAKTGRDGKFVLGRLAPGTYPVVARADGRTTATASVSVGDGASSPMKLVVGEGSRVEGTIVRKDGAPAAGAFVVGIRMSDAVVLDLAAQATVRADASGAFAFDALADGSWIFFGAPPGEGCSKVEHAVVPLQAPLVLKLEGEGILSGRVIDEADAPIAGARVVAAFAGGFGMPDVERGASTTTDAGGRYELRGISAASIEYFSVQADGYAPHVGRVDQAPEPRTNDVKLARGGVVRGVVIEQATKKPVAGVMIEVVSRSTLIGGATRCATTGADGRFEIVGVPTGRSLLAAGRAGWRQVARASLRDLTQGEAERERTKDEAKPAAPQTDPGTGSVLFVAATGDVVERTIEMFRQAVVRGRVVTADGAPVAGAVVAVVSAGASPDRREDFQRLLEGEARRRVSDADGRFEAESPVAAGRVVVEATAPKRTARGCATVEIGGAAAPAEVEIRLGTGASIVGRVTDATTGEPLAGAWIGWWSDDPLLERDPTFLTERMGQGQTAADGTYRFDLVAPGRVKMEMRGLFGEQRFDYVWSERRCDVEEDKIVRADFAAERALTISGCVLFSDGRPAADASVEAVAEDGSKNLRSQGGEYAKSDAKGAFALVGVPSGRYRVVAKLDDGTSASDPVVVTAGSSNVEIRMPSRLALAGFVRFKDGAPAPGMEVSPFPDEATSKGRGFQLRDTITGSDGSFRIDDLTEGTYGVFVAPPRGAGVNARFARLSGVKAGTLDLVVVIERGLSIVGRVVGPDGAPTPGGSISCSPVTPADPDEPMNWGGAEVHAGRFEIIGLERGKHWLVASAEGCAGTRVVVEAGARDVTIRLAKGATVKGRVLLPDGNPVKDAEVWIEDRESEGSTSARAFVEQDGTFALTCVGPGVHRVGAAEALFGEDEKRPPCRGEAAGVRVAEGVSVDGIEIRLAKPRDRK